MMVRLKMIGTGESHDPRRVPLPTWDIVGIDQVAEVVIVSLPLEDLPKTWAKDDGLALRNITEGPVIVGLSPKCVQEWYDHLDERYAEHASEYRPEFGQLP